MRKLFRKFVIALMVVVGAFCSFGICYLITLVIDSIFPGIKQVCISASIFAVIVLYGYLGLLCVPAEEE